MKADRRHIFPKKALLAEDVKTKSLIIAISHRRKSMTYYIINNRAVSVELTNISLYF
jgi:DNA integrity scanning protein DisA with diadenylate cyclase activity